MTSLHSGAVPSGLSEQTLLLDSDIRDWVVLPLLVIMVAAGLLRHWVSTLLKPSPKPMPSNIESRSKNLLMCAARLRTGSANYLAQSKWEARRRHYSDKEDGALRKEAEWSTKEAETQQNTAAIDPMNPMAMMDGMKGNMGEYLVVFMYWIVHRWMSFFVSQLLLCFAFCLPSEH